MRKGKIKDGIPNKCTFSYSRSVSALKFCLLSLNINPLTNVYKVEDKKYDA